MGKIAGRMMKIQKFQFPKDPWGTQVEEVYHPWDEMPDSIKDAKVVEVVGHVKLAR